MVPSTLRRTVAIAIAALVPLASVPAHAGGNADVGDVVALSLMMRGPKMDPKRAEALRISPQQNGKAMVEGGDAAGAGILYDRAASEYGDPILYLDAGDAYVIACESEENVDYCDAATERAAISLDILYFHIDSAADSTFMMVESGDVPDLIARAQTLQQTAAETKDKVLNPIAEPTAAAEPAKKRKKGNGKVLKISGIGLASLGGALAVVGVAGLGIGAFNQSRAEDPSVYGDEYDQVEEKGKRGNLIAGLGLGIGGAAAIAGVTLYFIGKRREKKAGTGGDKKEKPPEDEPIVRVAPTPTGMAVSGRF